MNLKTRYIWLLPIPEAFEILNQTNGDWRMSSLHQDQQIYIAAVLAILHIIIHRTKKKKTLIMQKINRISRNNSEPINQSSTFQFMQHYLRSDYIELVKIVIDFYPIVTYQIEKQ